MTNYTGHRLIHWKNSPTQNYSSAQRYIPERNKGRAKTMTDRRKHIVFNGKAVCGVPFQPFVRTEVADDETGALVVWAPEECLWFLCFNGGWKSQRKQNINRIIHRVALELFTYLIGNIELKGNLIGRLYRDCGEQSSGLPLQGDLESYIWWDLIEMHGMQAGINDRGILPAAIKHHWLSPPRQTITPQTTTISV